MANKGNGKIALITGGGQGIGQAVAERLHADGVKVAIADLNIDTARKVAEKLGGKDGGAIALKVNVADRDSVFATKNEVAKMLRQAGLRDEHILTEDGPPFMVINRALLRFKPHLLVIGTHGRTGIKRALLGGVAEQLISQAECDVLVVPPRRDD